MSRYRSYGRLDDPFTTEGDTFFLRMNARLRPNQLKPGEVALSKNGRMNDDGTWQPRKGLSTLFGSITTGEDAIRLPYEILSASRSSNLVSVVLDDTPSLLFEVGDNITISGLNYSTDNPNGTFALVSVDFVTRTIQYDDGNTTDETFQIIGSSQRWGNIETNYSAITETWSSLNIVGRTSVASMGDSIATTINYVVTNAVRASNVVTLTLEDTPSSEFTVSGSIHVDDIDASIDGTHTITGINTSAKTITYANTGADTTFTVNPNTVGNTSVASPVQNFTLNDEAVNAVFGSAVYSDAGSENDDFIFSATNNLCLIVRLKDKVLYKCRYDAGGETVDGRVDMTQGFDKMFIFRKTKTTLFSDPKLNKVAIASASQSGQTITVVTQSAHNRSTGDFVTLTNLGNWTTNPNDCYQITKVDATTFTVTMSGSQTKTFNVSGAQVEYFTDFVEVTSGTYTAPAYLTDTSTASVSGVVTMDVTSHGLAVGDRLTIHTSQSTIYDNFIGSEVVVTSVPTANQFTFNLGVKDDSNHSLTVSKPLAIGKGFIHMPAAPFGKFHQRRLWLPYQYTSDASPVNRNIQDELVASDIFDENTYDVIGNQFRSSAGQSDFLVGIHPFTEDNLVIFNRKSIHLMTGVSGSLADVKTNVVTTEIGASARNSIIQVANKIMFLSDQGIYAVEFFDRYNLRGTGTPISETIQPFIDRINQRYANLSVGAYFNNRYWLAVPLNSSANLEDGNKLNAIFVYNFINQGFESVDEVNSSNFAIRDLLVAREGAQNALYLTTEEGGVHKLDDSENGDIVSLQAGAIDEREPLQIVSQLTTRQYDADSIDRKNFSRAEFQIKSSKSNQSDADIQFITEDPDAITDATSISSLLNEQLPQNEDASVRLRVRRRGFGIQADIKPTVGRPYIRATKVDARITDRSTTSIS